MDSAAVIEGVYIDFGVKAISITKSVVIGQIESGPFLALVMDSLPVSDSFTGLPVVPSVSSKDRDGKWKSCARATRKRVHKWLS